MYTIQSFTYKNRDRHTLNSSKIICGEHLLDSGHSCNRNAYKVSAILFQVLFLGFGTLSNHSTSGLLNAEVINELVHIEKEGINLKRQPADTEQIL